MCTTWQIVGQSYVCNVESRGIEVTSVLWYAVGMEINIGDSDTRVMPPKNSPFQILGPMNPYYAKEFFDWEDAWSFLCDLHDLPAPTPEMLLFQNIMQHPEDWRQNEILSRYGSRYLPIVAAAAKGILPVSAIPRKAFLGGSILGFDSRFVVPALKIGFPAHPNMEGLLRDVPTQTLIEIYESHPSDVVASFINKRDLVELFELD